MFASLVTSSVSLSRIVLIVQKSLHCHADGRDDSVFSCPRSGHINHSGLAETRQANFGILLGFRNMHC